MNIIIGALRPHNSAMNIIKCWGGQYSTAEEKARPHIKQCGRSLINHRTTMNTIMGALRPHNSAMNIIKCWGVGGDSTVQQSSSRYKAVWEEPN